MSFMWRTKLSKYSLYNLGNWSGLICHIWACLDLCLMNGGMLIGCGMDLYWYNSFCNLHTWCWVCREQNSVISLFVYLLVGEHVWAPIILMFKMSGKWKGSRGITVDQPTKLATPTHFTSSLGIVLLFFYLFCCCCYWCLQKMRLAISAQ